MIREEPVDEALVVPRLPFDASHVVAGVVALAETRRNRAKLGIRVPRGHLIERIDVPPVDSHGIDDEGIAYIGQTIDAFFA